MGTQARVSEYPYFEWLARVQLCWVVELGIVMLLGDQNYLPVEELNISRGQHYTLIDLVPDQLASSSSACLNVNHLSIKFAIS